jgi:hypothetical protein
VTAAALLDDLAAAGVRLSLADDDLHYQTQPGGSLAPHVERITAHKLALLQELLQRRIVATVDTAPEQFDREGYDQLHQQLQALPDPEEDMAALVEQLKAGWAWLAAHPDHPKAEAFLARWIALLRQYERACAVS